MRVALIGLDGADFDLIEPWLDEGLLPNLARMRAEGYSATLRSVIPPLSAPAWTSAVTGVNPGRHGIFDFELVDRERFRTVPATALDRRAKGVWEYLTESNRRSVVITVPLTTPPDSIDGVMIGGFPYVEKTGFTSPAGLEDDLSGWRLDRYGESLPPGGEEAFLANLIATREARFREAIARFRQDDWELFWCVFMGLDKTQHFFWKFMDPGNRTIDDDLKARFGNAIRDFWIRIDEMIGEFADAADDGTVLIILSDHGFRRVDRDLPVLRWLCEEGYCDSDPRRSRVLYFTNLGGRMTINTRGVFPEGVVEPGREYDALVEELKRKLLALRDDATGAIVVKNVYHRSEIYDGPALDDAPDLLFEPAGHYFFSRWSDKEGGSLFRPPSYTFSAYHDDEGILILRGPHVKKGVRGKEERLLDIAPTVLRLLGEVIPREMDGVAMTSPFDETLASAAPLRPGKRSTRREVDRGAASNKAERMEALPYLR